MLIHSFIAQYDCNTLFAYYDNMNILIDSTDEHLLYLIRESDNDRALEELYRRYWQELYNKAFRRLHSHEVCEEIVQDIFIDLWNHRKKRQINNLQAYLVTSVRYQVLSIYNKFKNSPAFEEPLEHLLTIPAQSDTNIFYNDLRVAIQEWLNTLPEKRKEIFRLRYLEGLSTKEIAEELSITQKTVQNQLISSNKSLQISLSKHLSVLVLLETIAN